MNIIVIGCGKIGTTLVASLVAEGHDVVALDRDPDVISEITNIYDVMGVCGNGADSDILAEAGVADAEMVAAVTGSDELNMLACFLAKRMGAGNTIARIRNPEYNDRGLSFVKQQLDLSMSINPERLAAKELYNILRLPSAVKIETFSVRNFEMIELWLREGSAFANKKLSDLRMEYSAKFLICAVQRGDEAYIPDGNFVLKSGDKIGLTAAPSEIIKLFREMGIQKSRARNIMILGGSRTAYYLAKMLTATGNSVTIIEKDKALCEELCESLPKAVVINGDGAQQELLLEEGLRSLDAFVALTGMDEENILLSSYASSQNVPKVIAKVNRDELIPLAEHWGLESFVSPRKLIADVIIQYARALKNSEGSSVETLYKLMDGKVEALEFSVKSGLSILQKPFRELNLKPNILIAGIVRDRKTIIPSGEDMLMAGDKVIVLAAKRRLDDLSDILR
ncbi:MAG: Trk system potassium transporter TrkA [Clostridia bacterium]|nr:Trk system potassium transporter TrkA [Clostridia bacterium]MEE1161988.1 Trk system potassium transporter TrkA [Acutalibacteraceae bacterium]MEE1185469.1 Trk system potassium transporter TrkA [Acutalibacteraceae bacterium]MEE1239502.1 Trk system potassium transporter TrkA [Acutalibacteraceae bacterium]